MPKWWADYGHAARFFGSSQTRRAHASGATAPIGNPARYPANGPAIIRTGRPKCPALTWINDSKDRFQYGSVGEYVSFPGAKIGQSTDGSGAEGFSGRLRLGPRAMGTGGCPSTSWGRSTDARTRSPERPPKPASVIASTRRATDLSSRPGLRGCLFRIAGRVGAFGGNRIGDRCAFDRDARA